MKYPGLDECDTGPPPAEMRMPAPGGHSRDLFLNILTIADYSGLVLLLLSLCLCVIESFWELPAMKRSIFLVALVVACSGCSTHPSAPNQPAAASLPAAASPAAKPHAELVCSISFSSDKQHPTSLDDAGRACLDNFAHDLGMDPRSTAGLVGESAAGEPAKYATDRVMNARDYLISKHGISAGRIVAAAGTGHGQTVLAYLVPEGASFEPGSAGAAAGH